MTIAHMPAHVLQSAHPKFEARIMPDWKAWTIQEAAEKTGYNAEYIRRLCRQDVIEHTKIGRVILVKAESLMKYAQEMQNKDDGRYGPK